MKSQSCFSNSDLPTHLFKSDWDFNTTPSVILLSERCREVCIFSYSVNFSVTGVSELCPRGHAGCSLDILDLVFTGYQLCDFSKEP